MRAYLAFVIALLGILTTGCTQPRSGFTCTDSASCAGTTRQGTCQPNGACSFADSSCASGQRYGSLSDPSVADVCVGDENTGGSDGSVTPPATDMLQAFTTTDAMPVGSYAHASVVYNDKIYVSGGIVGNSARDGVFIGTPNNNALTPELTLKDGWAAATTLPEARRNHGMAVSANRLWVVAGRRGADGPNAPLTGDVLSAPLDSSGNVGTWTTHTAIPLMLRCAPVVGTDSHLYLVGGKDGTGKVSDKVLFSSTAGGVPGEWTVAGSLPAPLACPAALVYQNYLYVVGGCISDGGNGCTEMSAAVYSARIDASGTLGTFARLSPMPAGRWHHAAAIGNGFLYVVGGSTIGEYNTTTSAVWAAPILTDNTLGPFGLSRMLPVQRTRPSAQVVGDYLFVIHQDTQVAKLK